MENKKEKVVLNDKLLDKISGGGNFDDDETCSPDNPDDPRHEWVTQIGGSQTCFNCGLLRGPNG